VATERVDLFACEVYLGEVLARRHCRVWLIHKYAHDPTKLFEVQLDRTPTGPHKLADTIADDYIYDSKFVGWTTLGGWWPGSARGAGEAHAAEACIYLADHELQRAVLEGKLAIGKGGWSNNQWPPLANTENYQWQAIVYRDTDATGTATYRRYRGFKVEVLSHTNAPNGDTVSLFRIMLLKGHDAFLLIRHADCDAATSPVLTATPPAVGPLFLSADAIAAQGHLLDDPKLPISEGGSTALRSQSRSRAAVSDEVAQNATKYDPLRIVNLSHTHPDTPLRQIHDVLNLKMLAEDRWHVEAIIAALADTPRKGSQQVLDLIAHTTAISNLLAMGPWIIRPGQELDAFCRGLECYVSRIQQRFSRVRLIGCGSIESGESVAAMEQLEHALGLPFVGVSGAVYAVNFTGDGFPLPSTTPTVAMPATVALSEPVTDEPTPKLELARLRWRERKSDVPKWCPQLRIDDREFVKDILPWVATDSGVSRPGLLTRPLVRLLVAVPRGVVDVDVLFDCEFIRVDHQLHSDDRLRIYPVHDRDRLRDAIHQFRREARRGQR
jgi:hypothetical protein